MRHEQHGAAPPPRRAQRAVERGRLAGTVERGRRLVEQQHARAGPVERARERHAVLLAARQVARVAADVALEAADALAHRVRARGDRAAGPLDVDGRPEAQVRDGVEEPRPVRQQRRALLHVAGQRPADRRDARGVAPVDVDAADADRARGGRDEPRAAPQQRGLARAARADDARDPPGRSAQRDAPEREVAAPRVRDVDAVEGHGRRPPVRRVRHGRLRRRRGAVGAGRVERVEQPPLRPPERLPVAERDAREAREPQRGVGRVEREGEEVAARHVAALDARAAAEDDAEHRQLADGVERPHEAAPRDAVRPARRLRAREQPGEARRCSTASAPAHRTTSNASGRRRSRASATASRSARSAASPRRLTPRAPRARAPRRRAAPRAARGTNSARGGRGARRR